MADSSTVLRRLVDASTEIEQAGAWTLFLDAYSRLILHVARSVARDHDDVMDAYTYILQELQASQFARLRAFSPSVRCKFSTWLVVVTRRLCVDYHRSRYGRTRDAQSDGARLDQDFRRRLRHMAGDEIDLSGLPASADDPSERLSASELREALAAALETLSPTDRVLVSLRYEDGRPAAQIARMLNFPTTFHVYRRLDAINRALRAALAARGVEDAVP
jgi:RNA polymerase sigma factor (sigma-70 family)